MQEIRIFINDKPRAIVGLEHSVEAMLKEGECTSENGVLVTNDGITHDDPAEIVRIGDGDRLKVLPVGGDRTIRYQVNGEAQTTVSSPLTMGEILERAGASASINVNDRASYYLENLATEQRYDDLDAEVAVCEDDRFIAVHRGPTPVA
ncbi:MAG: hypothetical protein OXE81_09590 [Gammaproteobacteria bacterium]|nr:hypothetical protein [Gammaproteobacteria bacterium]